MMNKFRVTSKTLAWRNRIKSFTLSTLFIHYMMDNMQIVDDSTACFLSENQDVGTVVHEEEGEILRLESEQNKITFDELSVLRFIQKNEPIPIEDIQDEYDADDPKVESVVDELHHRGEVYQPSKGYYKVVDVDD